MPTKNNMPKLPKDDQLGYVDDKTAALLLRSPNSTRIILWVLCLFFVFAFVWASNAKLDKVTRGSGKVVPSSQLQVVQNLEGGLVKNVLVKEGDYVKKGQELLLIDDTQFKSNFNEQKKERNSLTADAIRITAELKSVIVNSSTEEVKNWRHNVKIETKPLEFLANFSAKNHKLIINQQNSYRADLKNLRNQLAVFAEQISQKEQELIEAQSRSSSLKQNYNFALKELRITEPLAREGVVPEIELLKLQRQVNQTKRELTSAKLSIPKIKAAIKEAVYKYINVGLEFRTKQQDALSNTEAKLAALNESKIGLQDRVFRTKVISPVNGTISKIYVNTIGGVIRPGMDLIEIVPSEDNLIIETRILPKDVAFLYPGLKAIIKFTAYDFSTYGGLDGVLENISADTQQDERGNSFYIARVRTFKNHLGEKEGVLPIIPGMVASVDILTGKRTVLDYLLKPIMRAKSNALRE